MAITVKTANADVLLAAIRKGIADNDIRTWGVDGKGRFFHTGDGDRWKEKARLRPANVGGDLKLYIEAVQEDVTYVVFGIYQGRFIEMMITHFGEKFVLSAATATAQASEFDKPKAA